MKEEQIHIPVKGSMAFARLWHAKGKPKALVLIIHGIGEHSLRYGEFALFLAHHGYNAVAYDLRGHGYSAVSSTDGTDKIALKKRLYEHPEFAYMSSEEGWYRWIEDLTQIIDYVISRYQINLVYLFGHSMGSMIARAALSILPRRQLEKLSGVILSSPQGKAGFSGRLRARHIRGQIRRRRDSHVSRELEKLFNNRYSNKRRFGPLRTELDWISSMPDEVDQYMADVLCGNALRLGMYCALVDINLYIYSRMFRRNLVKREVPLYILSGEEDPVSDYGREVSRLVDFFQKHGWQDVSSVVYPGIRHESLHDISKAKAMHDILSWLNSQEKKPDKADKPNKSNE